MLRPNSKRFWIWILIFLIALAGIIVALTIFKPTPPRSVTMATGPAGSANATFGMEYREYFEKNGVDLKLVESAGSIENFELLMDPGSGIEIAFLSMGPRQQMESGGIDSLGGVFFEPLWVFARGDMEKGSLAELIPGSRFSIGPRGSASNQAGRVLFALNGIDVSRFDLLELPPKEGAARLEAGSIDFLFVSSAASTEGLLALLANPNVELLGFPRADAYVAKYPALTKLTVPRGLGNLALDIPPADVSLLAFTTVLAVRDDLHPAIQMLLLDAASQIHSVPDMFHQSGSFPTPVSLNIELSSVAKRYYESGRPFLQRYLPFWIAVLVMQAIVVAIPLLGVLYPAVRVMPSVFDWAMRRRIVRLYAELRSLEQRARHTDSPEARAEILDELNTLERRARGLKVPNEFAQMAYTLRMHINVVQGRLEED
jgi:TRAP-type uncharacterized transport system substrate-binding protein